MRRTFAIFAAAVLVTAVSAVVAAAAIPNGNFEGGTFANWVHKSVGGGAWHIYSQDDWDDPDSAPPAYRDVLSEIPPPQGDFSPTLTQGAPSGNVLLRDLEIPNRAKALKLKLYWETRAERWNYKGTWKPGEEDTGNSYFAVQVLKRSAEAFSSDRGDILETIFAPDEGSLPGPMARRAPSSTGPSSGGWVSLSQPLAAYRGKAVTLRLAEVDDLGPIAAGIDDVKIKLRRP